MTTQTATKPTALATDLNVTNNPELLAKIQRVAELKAQKSAIEKELGDKDHPALEAEVFEAMEGKERAILRGVVIATRSSLRSRRTYNPKTLKTLFPEAEKAAGKTSYYTFFTYSVM